MNTLKISVRTSLLREIVTAFLVVAGMSLVGMSVADEPVAYSGMAIECYRDISGIGLTEYDKGKVRSHITGLVSVWRIDSDNPDDIMHGWEYTVDEALLNKAGRGTVNGELEMYPDGAYEGIEDDDPYTGWFVESYSFKVGKSPSGMYLGEGSLGDMTVTYETKPDDTLDPSAPDPCKTSQLPAHLCCFSLDPNDCDEGEYVCGEEPLPLEVRKVFRMEGLIITE